MNYKPKELVQLRATLVNEALMYRQAAKGKVRKQNLTSAENCEQMIAAIDKALEEKKNVAKK
ncbi:MAG TPA: hypothetical protein VH280_02625 [Verrucomicrobiae bacterium]|nr:hypothetical protein [Verrucomicrobiae bacterium]